MADLSENAPSKLRIDKWLWAARFFKTRSIASDAIAKNRVKVDGQRIKASRTIQVGDSIQIEKPPYIFDVTVNALNDKRRPAKEAQLMYTESEDSIATREATAANNRLDYQMQAGIAGSGRPSKKQRRQIIRFQNKNNPRDNGDENVHSDAHHTSDDVDHE